MDLLLINPPYFDQQEMERRYQNHISWVKKGNMYIAPFEPPLGLASLVSFLKGKGVTVELLDMPGLKIGESELKDYLMQKRPDRIGITAMSPTLFSAFKIARTAKSVLPHVQVVMGGVHPTLDPQVLLKNSDVDLVVRGE